MNRVWFVGMIVLGFLYPHHAQGQASLRICVLTPLSGPFAVIGQSFRTGIERSLTQERAAKEVTIVPHDVQADPGIAAQLAERSRERDNCSAIAGGLTSAQALAVADVARRAKFLYLEGVAGVPLTTGPLRDASSLFQTAVTLDSEARAAARFLTIQKVKQVELLSDPDSQLLISEFVSEAETIKLAIGERAIVPPGSTADTLAERLQSLFKARGVAVVVAVTPGGFETLANALARQQEQVRRRTLVIGGFGSPFTVSRLGRNYPFGIWAMSSDHSDWDNGCERSNCEDTLPAHQTFVKDLRAVQPYKRYADYPPFVIDGHIAMQFLIAAYRKSKSVDPAILAEALRGASINSPLGRLTMNPLTRRTDRGVFVGRMVLEPETSFARMDRNALYMTPRP